jgi:hypothetical protein
MHPGLHHHEAVIEGGRQPLFHHARRLPGRGLQQAHLGSAAKTCHRLHHLPGRRRHGLNTRAQQPGHLGLAQAGAYGGVVPPPAGGRRRQHAVAAQRVEQFHGLVRVAGRMRSDHLDQAHRGGPVHVQHFGHHGHETRHRQVDQSEVLHSGLLTPPGQRRRQRMRRVHAAVAVRTNEQQAVDRLLTQHKVDEAEWRAPRPLQVIDEEHQRPVPRGDRPKHRDAHSLRPHLRGQRIPGIGRHRQQRTELRYRRGQQTRVRANRLQDSRADLGQLVLGFGQQQPTQRAKRLMNGVELQIAPVLIELAGHEPAVPAGHHRSQLIDQRCLTHPRRAADQHPAAPARQCVLERCPQRRHLVVPSHQPRRRQQSQRNIVLAHPPRRHSGTCQSVPQPLQVVDHAIRGLVPVVRFLLQQVHDDLGQRPR